MRIQAHRTSLLESLLNLSADLHGIPGRSQPLVNLPLEGPVTPQDITKSLGMPDPPPELAERIRAALSSAKAGALANIQPDDANRIRWEGAARKADRSVEELTEDDFYLYYPIESPSLAPFQGNLSRYCALYFRKWEENNYAEYRRAKGDNVFVFSADEFQKAYGPPPWDIFNAVLKDNGVRFRLVEPTGDGTRPYVARLKSLSTNAEVKFADLSSGERTILSFALLLFYNHDQRQTTAVPELFLLDEVDAPLHPQMISSLVRTISNLIVGTYGKRVILVTHSPTTVAFSPDGALYALENSKYLRSVSKDAAMAVLTSGVPTLSIRFENRRQVFTESIYDAEYWEHLAAICKRLFQSEVSLTFIPAGTKNTGGCSRVKDLVSRLVEGGNTSVWGFIDWDCANSAEPRILLTGMGGRYSIENYILDPLLVAALLLRDKELDRNDVGLKETEAFTDLKDFDSVRFQEVATGFLKLFGWTLQGEESVETKYANGRTIKLPKSFVEMQGHKYEERLKDKFPSLNRFQGEADLKTEILVKILDDLPGLLPSDIVETLRAVQESMPHGSSTDGASSP
jgi:hypothetical protein